MKKRIKIVILVLMIIISVGIYFVIKNFSSTKEDLWDEMGGVDYFAYFVCEALPTDILWIGEYEEYKTFDYKKELPLRHAEHVDAESLNIRDGFKNILIVVNDVDSSVELSDEEYSLIFDRLLNDSRYNFYYYGSKKMKYVIEKGGYSTEYMDMSNISAMYTRVDEKLILTRGGYTREFAKMGFNVCDTVLSNYQAEKDKQKNSP